MKLLYNKQYDICIAVQVFMMITFIVLPGEKCGCNICHKRRKGQRNEKSFLHVR